MPSEKQIEAATTAIVDKIKTDGFIGYREAVSIILIAAEQAESAPAVDEEEIAKLIWERFAPAHEVDWPCGNAGEYRQVAKDIIGKFRP